MTAIFWVTILLVVSGCDRGPKSRAWEWPAKEIRAAEKSAPDHARSLTADHPGAENGFNGRHHSATGMERQRSKAEEQWGVEIVGLRLTAAGYMIDFRYKVLDPEKAAPLLGSEARPYLTDEASGYKFVVPSTPKVGSLRQATLKPEANRTYYIFFANPGKFIRPGNEVSIVIGDFKAEKLTVQ